MTTAIESKQDATKQSQKEQLETFSCMLDIGEAMLAAGADVDTVEDILVKMGKAYGAYKMDVLVITELIIATATMPGHNEHTLSRRILNEGSTNFDRLEALTDLCKSYCQSPIPADDLRKSLQRIKGKPFPKVSLYLGGALAAGGFAIFFGGSLIDGLVSAFFALGICFYHMGGNLALGNLGDRFAKRDIQSSSNYAIDSKGNVALYVEEANRAWTSSNRENDEEAITIEVANDEEGGNWHVSNESFNKLVELCVDICRRNGIEEIVYTGDTTGNLTYHGMFDPNTECPGPYLTSRMSALAAAINEQLQQTDAN